MSICHGCKKEQFTIIRCNNVIDGKACNKLFCVQCYIGIYMGNQFSATLLQTDWICFSCRGQCKCNECTLLSCSSNSTPNMPSLQISANNANIANLVAETSASDIKSPLKRQIPSVSEEETPTKRQVQIEPNSSKSVGAAEGITSNMSRGQNISEGSAHRKPLLDQNGIPYNSDYIFHIAVYTSLTPSEGTTLNCLSTNRDIEYLKQKRVIPSFKFTGTK